MIAAILTFLAVAFVVAWLILVLAVHITGGFIHLLLVAAVAIIVYQLYKHRNKA